jgi:protein FRA10AC1
VTRCKTKKRHNSDEAGTSKRKKMVQETPQTNDDQKQQQQQPNESENTHDSDSDDEGRIWREGKAASEEKSRDEEFQEYLEELLL